MIGPRSAARNGCRHAARARLLGRLGAQAGVATALVLALAGCAPGLSTPATEACNAHAGWLGEGRLEERRERIVETVAELLTGEDPAELRSASAAMTAALGSGDEAAFTAASAAVADACRENGWEPVEG